MLVWSKECVERAYDVTRKGSRQGPGMGKRRSVTVERGGKSDGGEQTESKDRTTRKSFTDIDVGLTRRSGQSSTNKSSMRSKRSYSWGTRGIVGLLSDVFEDLFQAQKHVDADRPSAVPKLEAGKFLDQLMYQHKGRCRRCSCFTHGTAEEGRREYAL